MSEAVGQKPMDMEHATAELMAALAAAQADAKTIGKDEENTQRGYKYASAEAMIRGAREAMAPHGLAFFSSWEQVPPDDGANSQGRDIGNQHVCAHVVMHWVVSHSSGGYVRGVSMLDAIGSRARPPDKAVAAALTYMRGFVLRDVLNLDRHDVDESEVVDQRGDSGQPQRSWVEDAPEEIRRLYREFCEVRTARQKAAGPSTKGAQQRCQEILGHDGGPNQITAEEWRTLILEFEADVRDMQAAADREAAERELEGEGASDAAE